MEQDPATPVPLTAVRLNFPPDADPAEWLMDLGCEPPSLTPSWPPAPGTVVVVVTVAYGDDGDGVDVVIVLDEARLNSLAAPETRKKKLFFAVPLVALTDVVSGLAALVGHGEGRGDPALAPFF